MPFELDAGNESAHGQGGRGDHQNKNSGQHSSRFDGTYNPRYLRAIFALLRSPQPRNAIDAITGSANGPDLISAIRKLGIEIPCVKINAVDRDGKPCKPGVYHLTDSDRRKVNRWLAQRAAGGQ